MQAGLEEVRLAVVFIPSDTPIFTSLWQTIKRQQTAGTCCAIWPGPTPRIQLQAMPEMKDCLFVPLKQKIFTERGKRVVRFVPYMYDLIFVHKSKEELDPIVQAIELLQYRYLRGGRPYEALSVRHQEFERFRQAVLSSDNVEYYSYEEVSPQIYGKQIRLIGGQLNGFEGRLMSKRGSKQKRLLIDLKECNLSASIQVETDYIQLLE